MFIAAGLGVSPWTVLAQGLSLQTGWSVGVSTFAVSVAVLSLWIPLKERPGLGTLMNAVIVSISIDVMTPLLTVSGGEAFRYFQMIGGVILIGAASGFYLTANLGPGPRDGLMTGLQRVFWLADWMGSRGNRNCGSDCGVVARGSCGHWHGCVCAWCGLLGRCFHVPDEIF